MPDTINEIRIKRGLNIPITGAPQQTIDVANPVQSVAVLGNDYLGIKPRLQVEEGDTVALGQTLFVSKAHPEICFTAPGAGVIKKIERGPKRILRAIEISLDDDDEAEQDFTAFQTDDLQTLDADKIREGLLTSGLWTALRTRPYSQIPDPVQQPSALFITAIDTNPLCANPPLVIAQAGPAFADGLTVLSRLVDAPVYVCTDNQASLDLPATPNLQQATFSGPHPAGLVGTHIHFLAPVSDKRSVWHLGYQDVIAIGRFFRSGRLSTERIISLAGPVVKNPRLLRTRLGACTRELIKNELEPVAARVVSGSILAGHHAAGWASYLGRYHQQISVLPDSSERQFLGWLLPWIDKFSASRVLLSGLFPRRQYRMTTLQNGSPRAMVPIGSYERVMPLDILATQLLRALLVRDTESAQGLGALELDEEDLALCSYVCPSKYDYGPVLRANLDLIEKEG